MEQVKEPVKEEREHVTAIACRIMAGVSPVSVANSQTQQPFTTPSPFSFSGTSTSLATPSTKNNGQRSPSFTEYPELIGILISDMISDHLSFVFDQLVGYLLISSASVAIPIIQRQVGKSTQLLKGTIVSSSMSSATFLVIAISALLSDYKLCKRLVW